MATETYEPVTFENSLGETISNDPIYLAQKTLENAGIAFNQSQPAQLAAAQAAAADDSDEDLDEDEATDYSKLGQKELKELADERGVDISSAKKVGEVRQLLIDADVKAAAEAEVAAANAQ